MPAKGANKQRQSQNNRKKQKDSKDTNKNTVSIFEYFNEDILNKIFEYKHQLEYNETMKMVKILRVSLTNEIGNIHVPIKTLVKPLPTVNNFIIHGMHFEMNLGGQQKLDKKGRVVDKDETKSLVSSQTSLCGSEVQFCLDYKEKQTLTLAHIFSLMYLYDVKITREDAILTGIRTLTKPKRCRYLFMTFEYTYGYYNRALHSRYGRLITLPKVSRFLENM